MLAVSTVRQHAVLLEIQIFVDGEIYVSILIRHVVKYPTVPYGLSDPLRATTRQRS
jgi:hypothetical protein